MLCYSTIRINKILESLKNYVVAVGFFCRYMYDYNMYNYTQVHVCHCL